MAGITVDGLIFNGDCTWQPAGWPEPRDPPNALPLTVEPWLGRADLLEAFLAAYPIGKSYLGGFITDRNPRNDSPGMCRCDLIVARVPNFSQSLAVSSVATKVQSKSATITNSSIISGASEVDGSVDVTYESPQTIYTYFAEGLPSAPRFTSPLGDREPTILRAIYAATGDVAGVATRKEWKQGSAPAPLVSALTMVARNRTTFEARPIPGTPWYDCTDTVSRELEGDA